MRMMLKAKMDVDAANQKIKDGSLPALLKSLSDELKPETAYYFTEHGCRAFFMVFDLKDTSQIPRIAEPLFSEFNAEVYFQPVMNQNDLEKGLQDLSSHRKQAA